MILEPGHNPNRTRIRLHYKWLDLYRKLQEAERNIDELLKELE